MIRSELVNKLCHDFPDLSQREIELVVTGICGEVHLVVCEGVVGERRPVEGRNEQPVGDQVHIGGAADGGEIQGGRGRRRGQRQRGGIRINKRRGAGGAGAERRPQHHPQRT